MGWQTIKVIPFLATMPFDEADDQCEHIRQAMGSVSCSNNKHARSVPRAEVCRRVWRRRAVAAASVAHVLTCRSSASRRSTHGRSHAQRCVNACAGGVGAEGRARSRSSGPGARIRMLMQRVALVDSARGQRYTHGRVDMRRKGGCWGGGSAGGGGGGGDARCEATHLRLRRGARTCMPQQRVAQHRQRARSALRTYLEIIASTREAQARRCGSKRAARARLLATASMHARCSPPQSLAQHRQHAWTFLRADSRQSALRMRAVAPASVARVHARWSSAAHGIDSARCCCCAPRCDITSSLGWCFTC